MKQVPLVGCSRCKDRWPLGGVVDTVHPESGERLPDHPLLMVVDQKVVCYDCVLTRGLQGDPLTEALYESLSRRPERPSLREIIRTVPASQGLRTVTTRIIRDLTPRVPRILSRDPAMKPLPLREVIRTIRRDYVPVAPTVSAFHADPMPATPINPVLSKQLREEVKKAEIERADNARPIEINGRAIPVVQGRMQGMFLRPSRWSLTEPVFQSIPMGTATPAYVPVRDDVLHEMSELSESVDIAREFAEDPTIQVLDRFKNLPSEQPQALRRQIRKFKKSVGM